MKWVYLSPHFDDAVYSCGGLIWQQTQAGDQVEIWTICAGEPPASVPLSDFARSLHTRWQTETHAPTARRAEDETASQLLGARGVYFDVPDCIYRTHPQTGAHLYDSEASLFADLDPVEAATLGEQLTREWTARLPAGVAVVAPLTLGNHVDHQLVRAAAEGLARPLYYYADVPYALAPSVQKDLPATPPRVYPLSDEAIQVWVNAVASYASQLHTFWQNHAEMASVIQKYAHKNGGARLWQTAK